MEQCGLVGRILQSIQLFIIQIARWVFHKNIILKRSCECSFLARAKNKIAIIKNQEVADKDNAIDGTSKLR